MTLQTRRRALCMIEVVTAPVKMFGQTLCSQKCETMSHTMGGDRGDTDALDVHLQTLAYPTRLRLCPSSGAPAASATSI